MTPWLRGIQGDEGIQIVINCLKATFRGVYYSVVTNGIYVVSQFVQRIFSYGKPIYIFRNKLQ